MPSPSLYTLVREILSTNLAMPADEVIARLKNRGITADPQRVRRATHNTRYELKQLKAAPAAARQTARPKTAAKPHPKPAAKPTAKAPPKTAKPTAAPTTVPAILPGLDLAEVLANVALVNAVVTAAGAVENARQVAEAVRACGGVDKFLQHLDLIAGIRGPGETV